MAEINRKKFKIFSLNANRELAQEIADRIGVPLSDLTVNRFADGEVQVNINETVRGHHVFVVQPTHNPVNENLMELLVMIDALKRASAKTINVIMPYYGYSRQDRKAKARQPITAKLVANLIEAAGATRVMTMDLHATQIQGFFDIPIDDFRAMPIIAKYFIDKNLEDIVVVSPDHVMTMDLHATQIQGFFDIPIDDFRAMPIIAKYFIDKNLEDIVVVSPDHGGATRARVLAEYLDAPIAIIDKRRPKPNVAEVMGLIGEVEGKHAIIIDDMIDTAGTIQIAANALKERGALSVYAACTHPILSGPAVERIENSAIKELVTTNTINLPEEKRSPKITQLSVGDLLAEP